MNKCDITQVHAFVTDTFGKVKFLLSILSVLLKVIIDCVILHNWILYFICNIVAIIL